MFINKHFSKITKDCQNNKQKEISKYLKKNWGHLLKKPIDFKTETNCEPKFLAHNFFLL